MKCYGKILLLLVSLFSLFAFPASAVAVSERYYHRLIDEADLLTESEEVVLTGRLDEESERAKMDFVIVAVWSFDGKSAEAFADDYYDEHGYGYGADRDGLLLLLGMESREWYISTCGSAMVLFSDAALDAIGESMIDDLADGRYADAFERFLDGCIVYASYDHGYGYGNDYGYGYGYGDGYYGDGDDTEVALTAADGFLPSVVIGVVIAFIVVSVMKGQLKSVGMRNEASDYVRSGSLRLTERSDLFLYRRVTKTVRQSSNSGSRPGGSSSVHRSSSGRSHGGRGGRF